MKTLQVYKKIDECGVLVFEGGIAGVKGLIIESGGNCGIFLNSKEIHNSDEEFMALAHEYGHYASGTLYRFNSNKSYVSQCEYRADRKAITEFLPIKKIREAIDNGCQTSYEFSEYLDLPEEFVVKAFAHYKSMGEI